MPAPAPESDPAIVSATGVLARQAVLRVAASHALRAPFRIGVERDVGDDGRAIGASGKAKRRPLQTDAANGDERPLADQPLPFADALQPLRRERHRLQDGRIDRPERDIIGIERQSAIKLGMIMRADPDAQARRANALHIGAVEIALAEMNEIGAFVDGDFPIVIDDELRAGARDNALSAARCLRPHIGLRAILDAQLNEPRADVDEPLDPGRAVDDRIETDRARS